MFHQFYLPFTLLKLPINKILVLKNLSMYISLIYEIFLTLKSLNLYEQYNNFNQVSKYWF